MEKPQQRPLHASVPTGNDVEYSSPHERQMVPDFLVYLRNHNGRQYYYSQLTLKARVAKTRTRNSLILILLLAAAGVSSLHPARGQTFLPHDPILINRDSEFAGCMCITGGSGTATDPWIISGWEITAVPTVEPMGAISIRNTRSYFIVRDVYLHLQTLVPESSGLYLLSVENGRFENSRVTNMTYGVWMSLSNRNTVDYNTFTDITRSALYVVQGSDNILSRNRATSNFPGVRTPLTGDPKIKYVDTNNDGTWTSRAGPTEPVVFDTNDSNTYDQGEPTIFGTTPSNGTVLKTDSGMRFFDFNHNGVWDPPEIVVKDENGSGDYDSGEAVASTLTPTGIWIVGATASSIVDNDLNYLDTGLLVQNIQSSFFDRNTLANVTHYGFRIHARTLTTSFRNNTITRVSFGLVFDNSDHDIASGNMLFENDYGIGLEGLSAPATNVTVTRNRIVNNLYGLYVYNSVQNLIYDNYLDNILSNGFDPSGLNAWNTTKTLGTNILGGPFLGGNFFGGYAGTDQDGDGIGDTGVPFEGLDYLPLVSQQPSIVRDIAVTRVIVQPSSVIPGDTFTITVYPFNQGTVQETFTVTTYYGQNLLNTTSLTLPPWTQSSYSFQWSSTGLATNTYSVTANATIIPGERDPIDNAASATATVNRTPTAAFTLTPQAPTANIPATFDASQSTDQDGVIVVYSWDFGDGQISSGVNTSHTYAIAGEYNVALTVTDNLGGQGISSRGITVTPIPNQEPIADISLTTTTPQVGQQVTFDGSSSHDPDGTIASYSWGFGDGQTSTGSVVTHTYSLAGPYTVKLSVTDNVGASNSVVRTVTVSAAKPSQPANVVLTVGTDRITLTWSAPSSDGGSTVTQYKIYRGVSTSNLALIAQVANGNTYEDKAVLRGETYYYQIRAVNAAGQEGEPGEASGHIEPSATSFLENPTVLASIVLGIAALAIIASLLWLRRPRGPGLKPPQ